MLELSAESSPVSVSSSLWNKFANKQTEIRHRSRSLVFAWQVALEHSHNMAVGHKDRFMNAAMATPPLQRIRGPTVGRCRSQSQIFKATTTPKTLLIRSKLQPKFWIYLLAILFLGCLKIIKAQPATTEAPSEANITEALTTQPSPPTEAPVAEVTASPAPSTVTEVTAPPAPSMVTEAPLSPDPATLVPAETSRPSFLTSPTRSFAPTDSNFPSGMPSVSPTSQPTFTDPIFADARFRQKFLVANGRIFNENEISIFETLYQSYTRNFALVGDGADVKIATTCIVDNQEGLDERRFLRNNNEQSSHGGPVLKPHRHLQESIEAINMDYTMSYTSSYYNVSTYPILFQNWINQNLETVTEQMQLLQLNVTEAQTASRLIVRTPAPTISLMPSATPTGMPTTTPYPTDRPSYSPTGVPIPPSTDTPSGGDGSGVVIITVSLLIGLSILGIGLLIYFRKRRHKRELEIQEDAVKRSQGSEGPAQAEGGWNGSAAVMNESEYDGGLESPENRYGSAFRKYADASAGGPAGVVSPKESLVSNQSLLSAGKSMSGDSGDDEGDTMHPIVDEFDQYKDQNLEKMRAEIEYNLEDCDGMMNQAVARALIDEDDLNFGATDHLWGGDADVTGPEIEASALGDVMDWLKRNDNASVDDKRSFLQDMLNRMVASVRHGVLGPSDGSRAMHECAALLGLQLAAVIPVMTVVISGMRKGATAQDIINTFTEFGNVSVAAVAPNERGFGILRFINDESVDMAMKKFRKEEVVVQDVGVQLKVIKSGSVDDD